MLSENTMDKVAVIGNSHVAALKLAYEENISNFDFQIDFFAARGKGIKNLVAEKNFLIPTDEKLEKDFLHTSSGLRKVDISSYKDIFIVGSQFYIPQYLKRGTSKMIREQVFDRIWSQSSASIVFNLIRTQCQKTNVFLLPCPMRALSENEEDFSSSRDLSYEEKFDFFESYLNFPSLSFCKQPDNTLLNSNFTLNTMSRNSFALTASHEVDDRQHPASDVYHMNSDYGLSLLEKYFKNV